MGFFRGVVESFRTIGRTAIEAKSAYQERRALQKNPDLANKLREQDAKEALAELSKQTEEEEIKEQEDYKLKESILISKFTDGTLDDETRRLLESQGITTEAQLLNMLNTTPESLGNVVKNIALEQKAISGDKTYTEINSKIQNINKQIELILKRRDVSFDERQALHKEMLAEKSKLLNDLNEYEQNFNSPKQPAPRDQLAALAQGISMESNELNATQPNNIIQMPAPDKNSNTNQIAA